MELIKNNLKIRCVKFDILLTQSLRFKRTKICYLKNGFVDLNIFQYKHKNKRRFLNAFINSLKH